MRTATACLSLVLLLSGCFSGLRSNEPLQQQFVLTLQPATPAVSTAAAPTGVPAAPNAPGAPAASADTLLVLVPSAAPGLSGQGIAVLRAGQRLDYYSNALWASDAPTMLQNLLIEALRRQGRFSLVESDSSAFDARYELTVDLTQFQAQYRDSGPPTVQVALFCTLGRRADRIELTMLRVNASVSASADRMAQVIAAFEQATNQVVSQVAQQIVPPAAPAPAPTAPAASGG